VTKSENLRVVLIYRPPSSGQNNLTELCEILHAADGKTIFVRDFNIPGIDWENERASDTRGRELLAATLDGGLQQLVNFPTHTKGNTLDLLLTNCPENVLQVSDIGRLGRSDHCIMQIVLDFQPLKANSQEHRYIWSRAKMDNIKSDLANSNWRETMAEKSVDEAWKIFKDTLCDTVERNVPKCGVRTRLKNPWMTREILRLIRKKRRKWRDVKSAASTEEMREYKELEKETAKKIRNAKRKLERDLANGSDKNNRKFARYIKSKTKSHTTVGPLLDKNNKLVTDEKEMADELNAFFSSVFTQEDTINVPEPEAEVIRTSMSPVRFTQNQIRNKIRKLRKDAAAGPDGIKPSLL